MKKYIILSVSLLVFVLTTNAQSLGSDSTLKISGSADIYYKYDFAEEHNNQTLENVVLGTKQNSINFGMLDLKIQKQINNASIVAELAFGSRPYFNLVDPQLAYNIQNLYVSYQASKKIAIAAGVMYRYQTFEKMTPADNFNSSMSNAFLNQYFNRSAGVRAIFDITAKTRLVVGAYNSFDPTSASDPIVAKPQWGVSDVCAQLFTSPMKNLKTRVAVWLEGKRDTGVSRLHTNFQAEYLLTKKCKLGLDATKFTCNDTASALHSYSSVVGYLQYAITPSFTIGGRIEHMERVEPSNSLSPDYTLGRYNSFTFTTSFSKGPITFKQEYKYDMTDKNNLKSFYLDKDDKMTDHASQVVVSAIYSF